MTTTNTRHFPIESSRAFCVAATLWLLLPAAALAQNTRSHAITVSAWINDGMGGGGVSTSFTEADADAMFADANALVSTADEAGDVSCAHTLSRSGPILSAHGPESDGVISSETELNAFFASSSFAKVVTDIQYCGGRLQTTIGGCTPRGALNTMVLSEWAVKGPLRGLVAVHEFGHAVGLDHDASSPRNFMAATAVLDNRNVADWQCTALLSDLIDADGPGSIATLRPGNVATYAAAVGHELHFAALPSIEELAHQVFFRVPVELNGTYGSGDIEVLVRMLSEESEWPFHPTAAMLLGVLGSSSMERATQVLVDYAERTEYSAAVISAVGSLGYLAERGSNFALSKLISYASNTDTLGVAPAVTGLGLSGRVEAHSILQTLLAGAGVSRPTSAVTTTYAPQRRTFNSYAPAPVERDAVSTALNANESIASQGLRGYYTP